MYRSSGFTLIELIVVIVLLGVMAVGAGMLVTRPIEAYSDQLRRQQLVDSADMALRKIATDIRRAVPNSIRIVDNSPNGWALEMINTVDGARYRDEPGGGFSAAGNILDFSLPDAQFNILGQFSNQPAGGGAVPLRVVIYNTSPVDLYVDAFNNNNPGLISDSGLSISPGAEHQVTLTNAFQFAFRSPGQRLFLVDGAVSYICDAATGLLSRFDAYPDQLNQISAAASFPVSANDARVATQVSACNIDYQAGTPQRGGLITLDLSLRDAENEQVRLLRQVHVDNVP